MIHVIAQSVSNLYGEIETVRDLLRINPKFTPQAIEVMDGAMRICRGLQRMLHDAQRDGSTDGPDHGRTMPDGSDDGSDATDRRTGTMPVLMIGPGGEYTRDIEESEL